MNNKGQIISIAAFFAIVLSIFLLGTLLMSFVNTILNPFESSMQSISNESASAVGNINDSFNKWWDIAIVFLFFLNVIILLLSAYQVDTHPIFLLLYIIAVMILLIFGGNMVSSLDVFYDDAGIFGSGNVTAGGNAIQHMPLTNFMLNNFTVVILGIIIISGIVMYAKFKFGGQNA